MGWYFDELLNAQMSVVAVGGEKRMHVFGMLNDRGVEEGISKIKGGKASGLDQCTVGCSRKGGRSMVAWLLRLFNWCFETGSSKGLVWGMHCPSIKERET